MSWRGGLHVAQYDVVMASDNLLDYPSLIATAVRLLQDPDHPARDELRAQYAGTSWSTSTQEHRPRPGGAAAGPGR
ncbi:MAG: hypothetical protein R2731_11795 [Nocardioides sp.]